MQKPVKSLNLMDAQESFREHISDSLKMKIKTHIKKIIYMFFISPIFN